VSYLSFHELYDAHHRANSDDLPFWLELAAEEPGPLLELGCGSGRVLIALVQQSKVVVGIDHDAQMLHLLRRHLPQASAQKALILQGDFTQFALAAQFSLIIMPCNTYSTLDSTQRKATLDCVRRHLLPGGRLVVSVPNPELLMGLPAHSDYELEESFPHPDDGEPVLVSSAWERSSQQFIVFWQYDRLHPDGTLERYQTEARHWLVPAQVYFDEMGAADFQIQATFGDFDRSAYRKRADQLIIIAG
jgi:SAM-dependent methyltransferase